MVSTLISEVFLSFFFFWYFLKLCAKAIFQLILWQSQLWVAGLITGISQFCAIQLFKNYLFSLYEYFAYTYVLCTTGMHCALEGQEMVPDPLELKLQMVVGHSVRAGN